MSSILGHGLMGMTLWGLARETPVLRPLQQKSWLAGAAVAACLPDLDALVGLPHRGPTHTLGFGVALGLLVALAAAARGLKKEAPALGLVALFVVWSHPAMDLLTGGGPDVALFRPLWGAELHPLPGGLPLTGYTHDMGGLFGLLLDPWTLRAMLIETAIFGSFFAGTVVRRSSLQIALACVGASVWFALMMAAVRS